MLALESPLDAYRFDLKRNPERSDFGASDTVWLLVAHCLQRIARAPRDDRALVGANCAEALRGLLPGPGGAEGTQLDAATVTALARVCDHLGGVMVRESIDQVCQAARTLSTSMANAGATGLAFSMMGHLTRVASEASPREQGLNLATQGLLARYLGNLDAAEEFYELAHDTGRDADDPEVIVRSLLGRGVIARRRGNYPKARDWFETGLADAVEAELTALACTAHAGLTIVATEMRDYDAGLTHGWAAFVNASTEDGRVEALINLAELALRVGEPAAAGRAFISVLGRTTIARYRLAAAAGAAVSAGRCGDAARLGALAEFIEREAERASLPYESAYAWYSLSTAFSAVGASDRAERLRQRARVIAQAGKFFELTHATEAPAVPVAVPRPAKTLADSSVEVIRELERVPAEEGLRLVAV
jgi:tetratricopeptide repeat protein